MDNPQVERKACLALGVLQTFMGLSFTRRRYAQELAIVLGTILVAWIVIQVIIIRSISWIPILYFILGIVELGLGFYTRRLRFKFV